MVKDGQFADRIAPGFRIIFAAVLGRGRRWSFLCLFGLMVSGPAVAETHLVFGTYASDKPTAVVRKFKPFLDYLAVEMSRVLNEPVTISMKVAKEYGSSIDQLANGDVDFARFGPASYVFVKQRDPGIRIIAMESKQGKKRFSGLIVVHQDSEIKTLAELKSTKFAFGDELSTIGRYLSQSHLLKAGVSSSDLSDFEYMGRHDLVGEAVGAGRFDAGALKESTYKKLVEKGVPIRPLFRFDNVTKPWLAASDIDFRVVDAMRKVMLSSSESEEVQSIAKNGFLAGDDADYDIIREAMEHSQAF